MAFKPMTDAVSIDVTAYSQRVGLTTVAGDNTIYVFNEASETIFIAFGDNTVDASLATSMPWRTDTAAVIDLPEDVTHVAAIGTGANGKVYFTIGRGDG